MTRVYANQWTGPSDPLPCHLGIADQLAPTADGAAAVASDHDSGSHGSPRPAPDSWSDTASDASAISSPDDIAEGPPASAGVRTSGGEFGAAVHETPLGSDASPLTVIRVDEAELHAGVLTDAAGREPAPPT